MKNHSNSPTMQLTILLFVAAFACLPTIQCQKCICDQIKQLRLDFACILSEFALLPVPIPGASNACSLVTNIYRKNIAASLFEGAFFVTDFLTVGLTNKVKVALLGTSKLMYTGKKIIRMYRVARSARLIFMNKEKFQKIERLESILGQEGSIFQHIKQIFEIVTGLQDCTCEKKKSGKRWQRK